ncbi:transcription factor bHLH121 [Iris pallida]|uniref:Transcription factor bHLH121 n=1 Tax=Iris pallida TaxID=29817 RepID=A0AAX6HLV7_IRIPA|nr:transcription factor bHLH121 [Iris pallida]
MDQWKDGFFQAAVPADLCPHSNSSQRGECDGKDPIAARKVQKADREKLRRDRLNEQFTELGNAIDPDRPKNDQATILGDTIQMLKDLSAQVDRLKTEYASLSEESRELTQEKNELREENATLKSEIDNLNAQYQQRVRCMRPWAAVDPSVVVAPHPPYPYPMPVPIPSGPIPIHPSVQPYLFFRTQVPGAIPNPSYVPHTTPCNPQVKQPSSNRIPHPSSSRSHTASRQDSRKSSDHQQHSSGGRGENFSDVVTELELKTPGSAVTSSNLKATEVKSCKNFIKRAIFCRNSQRERKGSSGRLRGRAVIRLMGAVQAWVLLPCRRVHLIVLEMGQ